MRNLLKFILVASIFLSSGCQQMWRMVDRGFVKDYDSKLNEAIIVSHDHDILIDKINGTSVHDVNAKVMLTKEYLVKAEGWAAQLSDFKMFIETNDKRLRRVGVNPDYVRDNVVQMLKSIQDNEFRFRQALNLESIFGNQ